MKYQTYNKYIMILLLMIISLNHQSTLSKEISENEYYSFTYENKTEEMIIPEKLYYDQISIFTHYYGVNHPTYLNVKATLYGKLIEKNYSLTKEYQVISIINFFEPITLKCIYSDQSNNQTTNYDGLSLMYIFTSSKENYSYIEELNEINKTLSYYNRNYSIHWRELTAPAKFEMYVLSTSEEHFKNINKDSYLMYLKNHKPETGEFELIDCEKFIYHSHAFSKSGEYIINIVGILENPPQVRFVFTGKKINVKIKKHYKIWIICSCIACILIIGCMIFFIKNSKNKNAENLISIPSGNLTGNNNNDTQMNYVEEDEDKEKMAAINTISHDSNFNIL